MDDWIAGKGKYAPRFISPQKKTLNPGESLKLIDTYNPSDLRFLYLDVTGNGADNVKLTVSGDSFYFSFSMAEMTNYNINSMIADIPSLILADPSTPHYILMYKPRIPQHFEHRLIVTIENTGTDPALVEYMISHSEEV